VWCDAGKSPDQRAQLLLNAMTAQERIDILAGDEFTGVAGGEHRHLSSRHLRRAGMMRQRHASAAR
jgi:hypothetical protein